MPVFLWRGVLKALPCGGYRRRGDGGSEAFSSSCSKREERERVSFWGWQSIHQVGMYTPCNNIH